jgi:DnaJ like chaperone protein
MALGKWIGGFLGLLHGGPLGALAGFALGALFDSMTERAQSFTVEEERTYQSQGERNGFLFSLMVLSAHIIHADGKIMHSEMEFVRRFLRTNFSSQAESEGQEILLRLF